LPTFFHRADKRDVGGLEHRVGAGDERSDTAGFKKTEGSLGHGSFGFGGWMVAGKIQATDRRAARRRAASRATTNSSLAGMTSTRGAESDAARLVPGWALALASRSSRRPRSDRPAQAASRSQGLFSPMPAVKTRASQPPSSKPDAPIQCRRLCAKNVDREPRPGVALVGGGLDVAQIVAHAGEAEETAFPGQLIFGLFNVRPRRRMRRGMRPSRGRRRGCSAAGRDCGLSPCSCRSRRRPGWR